MVVVTASSKMVVKLGTEIYVVGKTVVETVFGSAATVMVKGKKLVDTTVLVGRGAVMVLVDVTVFPTETVVVVADLHSGLTTGAVGMVGI